MARAPRNDDDGDGRMLDRLDERTKEHERRLSSLEGKAWAAVIAGFTAFIGTLFNLIGTGGR